MKRLCATALIAFAAIPVGLAGADSPTKYFVRTDATSKDAHVSLAVKGNKLVSGYVVEKVHCAGYPAVTGNFVDFGNAKVRSGRFRDVDRVGGSRDRVTGTISADAVRGRVRSRFDFTGPGPVCKTGERFTLEQVDRARWARYTKKARQADPNFPSDHRSP
jgi:hypothetical protein